MTETIKDSIVGGDAYSCCASCESRSSIVSQSKSDSFAAEEYQFRLDTFIEGSLEDDPFSARPVNHTRLRLSSLFRHTFELWLDHFLSAVWDEGHNTAGPFEGLPHNWLLGTHTEHVQLDLIGIGTQFGDY